MRSSYGYDSYRGRGGLQGVLKALIVILAVILVLAVAAFFLLQKYMVYGDDGKARLELPFFQEKEEPAPPDGPMTSQDLVVVTETPAPAEETASPTPAEEPLRVVMLAESALTGDPLSQGAAQGYNAVLFDMKGDDGLLRYASGLSSAASLNSTSQPQSRNQAILAVTGGETWTIARVSCLRDNHVPRQDHSMSLRTASGNWVDGERYRWLNPSSAKTRAYLANICGELAGLGFDEILLDNAGYPTNGNVASIQVGSAYDPDHPDRAVEALYDEILAALAAYPQVKLSIVTAPEDLQGSAAGQTAALLAAKADRVYVRTEDADALAQAQQALTAAGLEAEQVVCWHPLSSGAGSLSAAGGEAMYLK